LFFGTSVSGFILQLTFAGTGAVALRLLGAAVERERLRLFLRPSPFRLRRTVCWFAVPSTALHISMPARTAQRAVALPATARPHACLLCLPNAYHLSSCTYLLPLYAIAFTTFLPAHADTCGFHASRYSMPSLPPTNAYLMLFSREHAAMRAEKAWAVLHLALYPKP